MNYDQIKLMVLGYYIKRADGPEQKQDPDKVEPEVPRVLQVTADLINGGLLDGKVLLDCGCVSGVVVIGPTVFGREVYAAMRAEFERSTPLGRLKSGGVALVKMIASLLRPRR